MSAEPAVQRVSARLHVTDRGVAGTFDPAWPQRAARQAGPRALEDGEANAIRLHADTMLVSRMPPHYDLRIGESGTQVAFSFYARKALDLAGHVTAGGTPRESAERIVAKIFTAWDAGTFVERLIRELDARLPGTYVRFNAAMNTLTVPMPGGPAWHTAVPDTYAMSREEVGALVIRHYERVMAAWRSRQEAHDREQLTQAVPDAVAALARAAEDLFPTWVPAPQFLSEDVEGRWLGPGQQGPVRLGEPPAGRPVGICDYGPSPAAVARKVNRERAKVRRAISEKWGLK